MNEVKSESVLVIEIERERERSHSKLNETKRKRTKIKIKLGRESKFCTSNFVSSTYITIYVLLLIFFYSIG